MKSFPRAIAHIDADCFFASVEILKNPSLKGKPVCVCTRLDRRGIVTSASYEARPFGIRAGTPIFQAKERCPHAVFVQSNFEDYDRTSYQIFQIVRQFSPDVEVTSIDEAFVDLTGLRLLYRTSYEGIAKKIQSTVFHHLKIPVSIGIAETKLLAKLASNKAKPFGVLTISAKERENFLRKVPIGDLCGVGRNTEALLRKYNYETAFDLARDKQGCLKKLLGKRGEYFYLELNGTITTGLTKTDPIPKSLSHTRTFPDFLENREMIYKFSLDLLLKLLSRLRSYEMRAGHLQFFLITKDFRGISAEHLFPEKSADNTQFIQAFRDIFYTIFQPGLIYRKSGFVLSNLVLEDQIQPSLFASEEHQKQCNLMASLDRLSSKFGSKIVLPATLLRPINRLKTSPGRELSDNS